MNGCYWNTWKVVFTITGTQVPGPVLVSVWMQPHTTSWLYCVGYYDLIQTWAVLYQLWKPLSYTADLGYMLYTLTTGHIVQLSILPSSGEYNEYQLLGSVVSTKKWRCGIWTMLVGNLGGRPGTLLPVKTYSINTSVLWCCLLGERAVKNLLQHLTIKRANS